MNDIPSLSLNPSTFFIKKIKKNELLIFLNLPKIRKLFLYNGIFKTYSVMNEFYVEQFIILEKTCGNIFQW